MLRYQNLITRYPYPMNAIQSAVIASLSNATSQYLQYHHNEHKIDEKQQQHQQQHQPFSLQYDQCLAMALTNILVITPCLLLFNRLVIQGTLRNAPTWKRVAVDQFIMSPLLTTAIVASRLFFLVIFGSEVHTTSSFINSVASTAPSAVSSSIMFWLPQRFVAYTYCPPHLLLLFGSICSYFWNIIFNMILKG